MMELKYEGQFGNQITQFAYHYLHAKFATKFPPIEGFVAASIVTGELHFESSAHFLEYRDHLISKFIKEPGEPMEGTAIHIRGGDAAAEKFRCPPFEYYVQAIEMTAPSISSDIYTDDITDPVVLQVSNRFGIPVVHSDAISDFHAIRLHTSIIIGNSTFAWWAAWLSGHNNVIQCEPTLGWRSRKKPDTCMIVPQWKQILYDPPNH